MLCLTRQAVTLVMVCGCIQAQQDVESFLEQAAMEAVGSSYGPAGGRFASKDVRVSGEEGA